MNALKTLISLAFLVSTVRAAIYVTTPVQSTVYQGGQSADIEWVDDGASPLLSSIGECTVGLYNGEMVLVQSLTSVDVSTTQSFSFTPNPSAGPNGDYYLVFTSSQIDYVGWSATFTLTGMTGSAGTSDPGSSIGSTASGAGSSIGSSYSSTFTSSISSYTATTTSISSGISTITTPSSSGTSTHTPTSTFTTSASASATPSGAALRAGTSTSLAGSLLLALAGALVL